MKIKRTELYKQVWQTPMSSLCKQFGLTDNGLRKICKVLLVPVPDRGYWAKVAHGQKPSIPALPDPSREQEYTVTQSTGPRISLSAEQEQAVVDAVKSELDPDNRIVVAEPTRWHPAISEFRRHVLESVKKWEKEYKEHERIEARKQQSKAPQLNFNKWRNFFSNGQLLNASPFRVALPDYGRALLILDAFCKAAASRGFKVEPLEDTSSRLLLSKDGIVLNMRIASYLEQSGTVGVDFVPGFEYYRRIFRPTGKLRIFVGPYVSGEKEFSDSEDSPLEGRLNEVFAYIHKLFARESEKKKLQEAQRVAWEQRREEEAAEQERLKQLRDAEEAARLDRERRFEELLAEVRQWKTAQDLSSYLEHIERRLGTPSEDQVAWLVWAKSIASNLDPTQARLAASDAT